MRCLRVSRRVRLALASTMAVSSLVLAAAPGIAADKADYKRTEDVIYGRKFGTALTMDVFQPPSPTARRSFSA